MDDVAPEQLDALAEVHALLTAAGIPYWLFGGWAVDFHVGSVTRAHDDVDIAVWLKDVPRIHSILQSAGWRHSPSDDDNGGTGYEREAVRLELTYLARDRDGQVFTPLRDGRAPWPDGAFASDVRGLSDVRARVIALAALMRGKSSPRDDPADAAKDMADFGLLAGLAP